MAIGVFLKTVASNSTTFTIITIPIRLAMWSDCCYSGQWVVQSRRQTKMIVKSASGPLTTAYNMVFSAAMFKKCPH